MWEKVPAAEDAELKLFLFFITGSQEAYLLNYYLVIYLVYLLSLFT